MHTKASIISDLTRMNAPRDKAVLVHTSLRAVGEIDGRGEAFLEALIEYFTAEGGLLLIPTHTWDKLINKCDITLDMSSSETCVGTLPGIAAAHPMAHRSLHPTHSMAVFDGKTRSGESGPAEDYIASEVFADTPAPPNGCYGKICSMGGKILLIGVSHNRNTFLHAVEEDMDIANRLHAVPSITKIRMPSGEVIERLMRGHHAAGIGDVSLRYPKYEPAFRYYGAIEDGMIGNASVQLCDAQKMAYVLKLTYKRSGGIDLMADEEPIDEKYYK